jgi:beta-1,4-mannosyltransferase
MEPATIPVPVLTTGRHTSRGSHRRRGREVRWHRFRTAVLVVLCTAILYIVQAVVWPHQTPPHTLEQDAWSWSGLIWCVAFVPAMFELTGLFMWKPSVGRPYVIRNLVCWRVVSKGENRDALRETIASIRTEMSLTPLFPYVIEVVLDHSTNLDGLPTPGKDLAYIQVPKGYRTRNGSLAKARALNYALWYSPLPAKAWIVHMDEESHPTESSIIGIAAAIREEEANGRLRIGQGTITYHRDWRNHPYFTLADCIRTGSDLGKLYLSMAVGVPLFGLHGSFIVLRNDVERTMGFDVGPVGSLTEDAWWGTQLMDRGYRCRWVEGHVSEQCTHKPKDFLKQRRRWFNGLARTSFRAPTRYRWRAVLTLSMFAWASAPIAWVYTVTHMIEGGYIPPVVRILADIGLAVFISTTLIGLRVNMRDHGIRHPLQKVRWALTWLVCLPFFSLLESTAVAYAMIKPAKLFDVVHK